VDADSDKVLAPVVDVPVELLDDDALDDASPPPPP